MAKVLCVNDFKLYSEMVSLLLHRKGGHDVRTEIVPFAVQEIEEFQPDVIILNLVRKMEALRSPLADFYSEVDGARAYRALAAHPSLSRYPIVLTAIAVEERELPKTLPYVAFIEVPGKLDQLLEIIDRIVAAGGADIAPE